MEKRLISYAFVLFFAVWLVGCRDSKCSLFGDCRSSCPTLVGPAKVAGWTVEKLPMNRNDLFNFIFPDSLVGFAKSFQNNQFFKTSDGGKTWFLLQNQPARSGLSFAQPDALFFKNKNEGWLAQNRLFFNQTPPFKQENSMLLFKTTDGGVSWKMVGDSILGNTDALFFQDSLHGWAAQRIDSTDVNGSFFQRFVFVKTTDGGENWLEVPTVLPQQFGAKIIFPTAQTGYVLGNDCHIYRTQNGGQDWLSFYMPCGFSPTLFFTDEKTGFTVNDQSQIFQTTDGGENWYSIFVPSSSMNLLQFSDATHGLLFAQSRKCSDPLAFSFFGTSDGGSTWEETDPILNVFGLSRIDFPTTKNGFVTFACPNH